MVNLTSTSSYRMLVFDGQPVREQRRVLNGIEILFYDGTKKLVDELDWRNQSRNVFIPKNCGGRRHVANNWAKYSKYH